MTRRQWLVLGLGGLVLSAVSRVAIASPTQVEAEGYAGSSTGQWTCGPTARASYGGVGGSVRFYPEERDASPPPPEEEPNGGLQNAEEEPKPATAKTDAEPTLDLEPHGFSFGAGGGGEYRDFTRVACSKTPCSTTEDVLPPARLLGAGRASLGYDWDHFGVHAGALAFQRWADNRDRSPTVNVLPDVELRFGRRAALHGGVGFGAYNVSTIFRPGAYLALGYAGGPWAAELRTGVHATFDDQAGFRGDVSVRYGVSRVVAPGLGVAVSSAQQVAPEGRLFLVLTP
jgi:hypothetical protein